MAGSPENAMVLSSTADEDEKQRESRSKREIISTLPTEKAWKIQGLMYQYQGFWYYSGGAVEGVMWMQKCFKARNEDVLLVSFPKCGTTWLKSLMFSIMNRTRYDFSAHPLLTSSPHELVPFLEFYAEQNIPFPDLDTLSSPQLFHTHIAFTSLPQPVIDSQCRIVYICRNPKDVFVSSFCFISRCHIVVPLEEAFEFNTNLKIPIKLGSSVFTDFVFMAGSLENAMVLSSTTDEDEKQRESRSKREIISTLPTEKGWKIQGLMYQYQGFWYYSGGAVEGVMWMQKCFKARNEDVLLVSFPRCGTTWLKSLMFSIMNRTRYDFSAHPLLTSSPHELVPFLEFYAEQNIPFPDLDTLSSPQLYHTHIALTSLPQPVIDSQCRVVYICRNPKDVFVSIFYSQCRIVYICRNPFPLKRNLSSSVKGYVSVDPSGIIF
ncbi:unnamed protein product, partial [Vitis vinifera]|uniref:Sulfotransferase n=1 Tax=Vitis vinifera TaxID=29760 RepID=D7T356_VITVI